MKVLLVNNMFELGGAEKVFSNQIKLLSKMENYTIYTASCDEPPESLKPYIRNHLKLKNSKRNPFSYIFDLHNFLKLYKFLVKKK